MNILYDLKKLQHSLQLHSLKTGELLKRYSLDAGTIVGFSGDKDYSEFFFHSTSFISPGVIHIVDLKKSMESKVSEKKLCIKEL